jgi:hypothetical protein
LRDDLEEQLGAGLAEGNEAEFVDDQKVLTGQLWHEMPMQISPGAMSMWTCRAFVPPLVLV